MKVNLNNKFVKDFQGNEVEVEKNKKQSIKDVVCQILFVGCEGLSSSEKYRAYQLSQILGIAMEEVELESEDVTLMKKIVDRVLTQPGQYAQVIDAMEGRG